MQCVEHVGQQPVFIYIPMLCCDASVLFPSLHLTQVRVTSLQPIVMLHSTVCNTPISWCACMLVMQCHAISSVVVRMDRNFPKRGANSLSVVLVVFACMASSGWHDTLARQVLVHADGDIGDRALQGKRVAASVAAAPLQSALTTCKGCANRSEYRRPCQTVSWEIRLTVSR